MKNFGEKNKNNKENPESKGFTLDDILAEGEGLSDKAEPAPEPAPEPVPEVPKPEEEPSSAKATEGKPEKTIAELEDEMQILKAAYAPLSLFRKKPVVQDLGYYLNQNRIKEIEKEIARLKAGKPAPAESKKVEGEKADQPKESKKDGWIQSLGKKIKEQDLKGFAEKVIDKTKQGIKSIDNKLAKRKTNKALDGYLDEQYRSLAKRKKEKKRKPKRMIRMRISR